MRPNECDPSGPGCIAPTTVVTDNPMRQPAPVDPVAGRCSPGYPSGIAPDAPCVDADPCMADGTTLWGLQPCTPATTTTVGVANGILPSTGIGSDGLVLGAMFIAVGAFMAIARRRPT